MNVRDVLITLNIVGIAAIAAYVLWAVFSPRRARREGERTPANQEKFLDDDDLEGRRLERVLGWSLLFGGILAVALPLYWLREPTRQDESVAYFDEGAVARGETLFSNATMPEYDSVLSLQCANCHGADAGGGVRNQIIDLDGTDGPQRPQSYPWKVPALNTVLLRFSEEEVARIITYGRPGTPMQPFGVDGGGAENEQTITDIVAYLKSIQLSSEEATAQSAEQLAAWEDAAAGQVKTAQDDLEAAQTALADAKSAAQQALGLSTGDDTALQAACEDLEAQIEENPEEVTTEERAACKDLVDAYTALDDAQANLDWAITWRDSREDADPGQYLFEQFCARCHTEGWSAFDPADPNTAGVLGLPGGGGGQGGGIGFNLRDGGPARRFGEDDAGFDDQVAFVTEGSDENKTYGEAGIGSGRMPGFGQMLTRKQIEAIVTYEREGLDDTTYPQPGGGDR